jgi:archaellum biogenesis protein FlaJ (TadC family)
MLEKLGGLAAIVVAVAVLYFVSVFKPPTFIQILCALAGSIICLIGVVFLFAEGRILTKDRRIKKASKVG